ncbi:polysaccharide pyruvyl transferase family protein [Marinobacter sp.]|uniref:polysaccharide pyruvyl transferase family protein n=1 Tax=Marinobacter sp. TaxID=50741 RepID=UPI0019AEE47C|nr:polysaccharide pyruvyl transferase family protein [Marinobacter sp.]MBC7192837.1 polysaccharide pyruvyl transferase family protein [Marinobacter sp.]
MTKKILIINSDSPHNKGDQAILLGNINLIRYLWQDAKITAISDNPTRDEKWFGIEFIDQKVYTLNPISILKLTIQARKFDYVFWGGGELLKDYTNKIAPIYWFIRILLLNTFGVEVYGLFQGIGPSKGRFSKFLIARSVDMTKIFFVRDHESRTKLISYGADPKKIVPGYDPAILNTPKSSTKELFNEIGIKKEFIENSIIVSPRRWFHYTQSTWTPAIIQKIIGRSRETKSLDTYKNNLAIILKQIKDKHNVNVIFFPMFTSKSEGDTEFSIEICDMIDCNDVIVVDSELVSPESMLNLFSLARATMGSRLHSSIVSISAGTPSVCLYYVDKGRIFFDQIDARDQCFPIEAILTDEGLIAIGNATSKILGKDRVSKPHENSLKRIRKELLAIFESKFENDKD